ncbi:hypothetical protein [Spirilliplanes yamanashiensis]|uniref:Uncharacterized protein n=1 Tax=Spirilliplanes yamanashiensis TaxID=42233 RepID=A0A8J3Y5L2_9ACTN|nr:hypothetical protein [Spirilliplanes yamanashiensis]MDP9814603.1 hypothetical protein [Spirilliplanes yamanashiensis]GIJ02256.1 hypothetical protein Sya03_16080 [Spirilliplanes yamanashiensis]
MADRDLDDALHSLAGDIHRTGRVAPAADIRRRGDRRRRRHTIGAYAAGVVAIGVVATGIAVAQPDAQRPPSLPAGPTTAPPASVAPPTTPPVTPSANPSRPSTAPTSARPTQNRTTPAGDSTPDNPILAGDRRVAVVRVKAFEGGVALSDDGALVETDDDSGSQSFVLVPLDDGTHLIQTTDRRENNERACWKAKNNGVDPLSVAAAACRTDDAAQQFTVRAAGDAWTIENRSAYLRYSPARGLILEEAGDGPEPDTFYLVDNGPAPN